MKFLRVRYLHGDRDDSTMSHRLRAPTLHWQAIVAHNFQAVLDGVPPDVVATLKVRKDAFDALNKGGGPSEQLYEICHFSARSGSRVCVTGRLLVQLCRDAIYWQPPDANTPPLSITPHLNFPDFSFFHVLTTPDCCTIPQIGLYIHYMTTLATLLLDQACHQWTLPYREIGVAMPLCNYFFFQRVANNRCKIPFWPTEQALSWQMGSASWAHSEGHPQIEGTFIGTLVNVRDLRRNSGECQGGSREYGAVGSPKFTKLHQPSPKFA